MTTTKETKLKRVLNEIGMSQYELCKKTGLAWSSTNEIVAGKIQSYQLNTLFKICKAIGKTPNDILDYEQHMVSTNEQKSKT